MGRSLHPRTRLQLAIALSAAGLGVACGSVLGITDVPEAAGDGAAESSRPDRALPDDAGFASDGGGSHSATDATLKDGRTGAADSDGEAGLPATDASLAVDQGSVVAGNATQGQPGIDTVVGGQLLKSGKYALLLSIGEAPGGNGVMTSTHYRFVGGVVGTTQH